jgi:predicted NBD/HSP70 family sugar kinase
VENSDARRTNKAAVVRLIVASGETTRQQIVEATKLSKATVSRLIRELIEEGLVIEGPIVSTAGAGRSTQVLRFSGGAGRVCGIDLGASNSRFIITDFRAALTAAWTEPTPKVRDAEQLADWIAHRVRAAHDDGRSPVVTAIGLPGAVVPEEGRVLQAPNMPKVEGVAFSKRLARQLDGGVRLDNDANLALIGELTVGAATDTRNAVMFTVGVGLGAGVVVDGSPATGRHGLVGEFGSVPVSADELLEDVLSGSGILRLAQLHGIVTADPYHVLAGPGSAREQVRRRVVDAMHMACAMAWAAYEPDTIIFGGRVAPSLAPDISEVQRRLDAGLTCPPKIVLGELGDYAGALGAVAIALESAYRLLGAAEGGVFDPRLHQELAELAHAVRENENNVPTLRATRTRRPK